MSFERVASVDEIAKGASIASPSRSRSSSTGILLISSAKKPRTTSLRASPSGMPRAIR
jgi:hypothetical protein